MIRDEAEKKVLILQTFINYATEGQLDLQVLRNHCGFDMVGFKGVSDHTSGGVQHRPGLQEVTKLCFDKALNRC